jgi:hypothetical protein
MASALCSANAACSASELAPHKVHRIKPLKPLRIGQRQNPQKGSLKTWGPNQRAQRKGRVVVMENARVMGGILDKERLARLTTRPKSRRRCDSFPFQSDSR